jgi:hypothetical protein
MGMKGGSGRPFSLRITARERNTAVLPSSRLQRINRREFRNNGGVLPLSRCMRGRDSFGAPIRKRVFPEHETKEVRR